MKCPHYERTKKRWKEIDQIKTSKWRKKNGRSTNKKKEEIGEKSDLKKPNPPKKENGNIQKTTKKDVEGKQTEIQKRNDTTAVKTR